MPINNVSGASLSQPHSSEDELVWCSWVPPVRVDSLWGWAVAASGVDGTPWREIWGIGFRRSETIAPERRKSCGQAAAASDSTERGSHAGKAAAGLPHSK